MQVTIPMKILCAFARYSSGVKARGSNIDYEAFVPGLRALGHEVFHLDTFDSETMPTYESLNACLLRRAMEIQPDIVFTVQRDCEIWIETLQALANMGIALATWTTDDSFKFFRVSKFIGSYYDAISTTYDYRLADYKAAGIEGVCYTQWAANAHWLRPPKPASECRYGVSFVGTCYGGREKIIAGLRDAGIRVDCFGYGWPNGAVQAERIPEIMQESVVSLNFSAGYMGDGRHDRQIKARTFEVPGAGGFLLTEAAPGLDQVYRVGEEIETYDGFEQLKSKISYYLERPSERDRIAIAGYDRTKEQHTYDRRLKPILELALARRDKRREKTEVLVGTKTGGTLVRDDRVVAPPLSLFERAWRKTLVAMCQLVWGSDRGLRAARRMTFELSVRISGARTFTAKGIPGRMFPYV